MIINYAPIKYSCGSFYFYSALRSVCILVFLNSKSITRKLWKPPTELPLPSSSHTVILTSHQVLATMSSISCFVNPPVNGQLVSLKDHLTSDLSLWRYPSLTCSFLNVLYALDKSCLFHEISNRVPEVPMSQCLCETVHTRNYTSTTDTLASLPSVCAGTDKTIIPILALNISYGSPYSGIPLKKKVILTYCVFLRNVWTFSFCLGTKL